VVIEVSPFNPPCNRFKKENAFFDEEYMRKFGNIINISTFREIENGWMQKWATD